ncbi:MAG: FecR domain-containing protein [Pseudomonadota bacterium]
MLWYDWLWRSVYEASFKAPNFRTLEPLIAEKPKHGWRFVTKSEENLAREAVRILMRLRENPNDPDASAAKALFIARGSKEKEAWKKAEDAWSLTGVKKLRGRQLPSIIIAAFLLLGLLAARDPVFIWWHADVIAKTERRDMLLSSGDAIVLDVGSAIADDTDMPQVRRVTLLSGAAFFDVEKKVRSFEVNVGDVSIDVIGTSFSVEKTRGAVEVSVKSGRVRVRNGPDSIELTVGQRLRLTSDGIQIDQIVPTRIAPWLRDQMLMDGMLLADVTDILDRRLAGPIILRNEALAQRLVSGGIDLSAPEDALRALALSQGASVVHVPGLGTYIRP